MALVAQSRKKYATTIWEEGTGGQVSLRIPGWMSREYGIDVDWVRRCRSERRRAQIELVCLEEGILIKKYGD